MTVLFVSHPEVQVEADRPVPRWALSDSGISRMRAFARSATAAQIDEVWASEETKAIEAAGNSAGCFGLPVEVDADPGENDRSSTGFLPRAELEATADFFFAHPDESVRGWERARDAQSRILAAVDRIIESRLESRTGDLAIVAHGGVGTLMLCAYLDRPISRAFDQPFQGHFWAFDAATRRVIHPWLPIDADQSQGTAPLSAVSK